MLIFLVHVANAILVRDVGFFFRNNCLLVPNFIFSEPIVGICDTTGWK